MRQYTFQAISRDNGAAFPIRATASSPEIARAHIVNYYGQNFEIAELFMDVNPAHHILGEIDCTDADIPDTARA